MEFNWEGKYIVIAILSVGFLIGAAVLWQKNGAGFGSANLSRALGGNQWIEIKPRGASSTAVVMAENETKAAAKTIAPAVVWCEIKPGAALSENNQIIINEIAWMGSQSGYSDEWLELKNISADQIDLNGWQLQNKNQKIKIAFDKNDVLAPAGFYLLERTDDDSAPGALADKIYRGSLANLREAVYLFDQNCRLQDSVAAGVKWPAGDNLSKKTMIRRLNLGWQTSAAVGGTPGAENR